MGQNLATEKLSECKTLANVLVETLLKTWKLA